ncbi:hypothetical protein [Roseibium album]|uniref:hypothetical protein n=1 Tax=Roseibium album TaxID=311410 RepID=UPI002493013D|nr:hypothetical protein [Roseibium album]
MISGFNYVLKSDGRWVDAKGDITLDELVVLLADEKQISAHRATVGRLLQRLGLTHKKRPAGA